MLQPRRQLDLFDEAKPLGCVVNVASVTQRSPFRYPGGKTWLIPRIRQWLGFRGKSRSTFIEPFAGGGIVSLTVAAEGLAERVIMVELDEQVAAVWNTVFSGNAKRLAKRIVDFALSLESLREELAIVPKSVEQMAFQTVLKNRTFHGGILAVGSAPIKNGENGKGIQSRWYPATLEKRILDIARYRDKIQFIQGDGLDVISKNTSAKNTVFFVDPPYTAAGKKAGKRLYTHHQLDHEKLFYLLSKVKGDFLITYDNADGVLKLAKRYSFDTELIAMKNTHHAEMTELLISNNLKWLKDRRT